jgi:hypothetical protein
MLAGASSAPAAGSIRVDITYFDFKSKGSVARWTYAFNSNDGATDTFARVGNKAIAGANIPSQDFTADPPSAPYGDWVSYGSGEAAALAIVLAAVAGTFAYLGTRVRSPISVRRPGRTVSGFMIAIWLLAIYTFIVAFYVIGVQLWQVHLPWSSFPQTLLDMRNAGFKVHVVTLLDATLTFLVILYITRRFGWRIALASAFIATVAGWMFFELPFDLIVMGKTYPPIPPLPILYRQLFFLPLFIIELSTISLLTLLPSMRITRNACYALAAMFAVFAVWAVFGFAFPSEPIPFAFNIISKVLCFVASIMLFVWHQSEFTTATTTPTSPSLN